MNPSAVPESAPRQDRRRVQLTPRQLTNTLRRMMPMPPMDMRESARDLGAMCGHGALAAALGIPVAAATILLGKPGSINIPTMANAIRQAGYNPVRADKPNSYQRGVLLVQFDGPWTEPGQSVWEACCHRHWVAARRGFLWDSNLPKRWQTQDEWKRFFVRHLAYEGVTGFCVRRTLLIS